MQIDKDLFTSLHPNFFEQDYVKNMDSDEVFDEMILKLKNFLKMKLKFQFRTELHLDFGKKV